jgi:hypothetical protein
VRILVVGRRITTFCHRSIHRPLSGNEGQSYMVYRGFSMSRITVGMVTLALVLGVSSHAIALERLLAGITLGSQAQVVLKKYGTPDRIGLGASTTPLPQSGLMTGSSGGGSGISAFRDLSPLAGLSSVGPMPMGSSSIGSYHPGGNPIGGPMAGLGLPSGPSDISSPGMGGGESATSDSGYVRWDLRIGKRADARIYYH